MTHQTKTHGKGFLGDCIPSLPLFASLDECFLYFKSPEFTSLSLRKRFKKINVELLKRIQGYPSPCFLLPAVLDYINRVNTEEVLEEEYTINLFEFWLNQFSGLLPEEVLAVRGKIAGRYIPRDEYQCFFPVGSGKLFSGSHFVAAHLSPDVDTTTSSFWGWVDAFGCRVAEGVHQWSLPSGLSDGHIRLFFQRLFGEKMFEQVARPLPTITISALDLLTTRDFHKVPLTARADTINHTKAETAVIIVDEEGLYKGEWRSQDAEAVRQIVAGFSNCLRWFESHCLSSLIHVFAKEKTTSKDVKQAYERLLASEIKDCAAAKEIPAKGKKLLHDYIKKVLGLDDGLECTFAALLQRLDIKVSSNFSHFLAKCHALTTTSFYDEEGVLKSDRVHSTRALEHMVKAMEDALDVVRQAIDRLDHLLTIKEKVLSIPSTFVSLKSDVEEMKSKIGHAEHLTVVIPENGAWFPLGVVQADELKKSVLGTASFRDFSNSEETKMASYIDVISIVDHHKTKLQTSSAPTLLMGDTQSSNTLVAEQSLDLNIRYGVQVAFDTEVTVTEKVHKALGVAKKDEQLGYFVDPNRELAEYFSYLYGILDDTDLLTKVSRRDVLCCKNILDRMKSLVEGRAEEAVSFEHIPNDATFAKRAAKVLLQNHDLHSIYANVYKFREKEVEEAIVLACRGEPSSIFMDTKEQNGCCRAGQTKLFLMNLPSFLSAKDELMAIWQTASEKIFRARPHIDFFLHMISTVPGEKEVFHGKEGLWDHQDQIWIWTPDGGVPEQHLIGFLNSFQTSPAGQNLSIDVEIHGPLAEDKKIIFLQNLPKAKSVVSHPTREGPTIAVLKFPAGSMTSRKSQISPYLPKLIS
jgi:hypothetical protein